MKVQVLASTKIGYCMPKEEALLFSGRAAGICYLPDTIDKLFSEPEEKTLKRANANVASGHHSVFGHATYNFILEDVPKILAMILNNEKVYTTSEKSARYTVMKSEDSEEKKLYEKWIEIFKKRIFEEYPKFDEKRVKKLAQENARYLISIFTPSTSMEYTVNFEQLNYIIGWSKDYINNEENNDFSIKLKDVLKDFLENLPDIEVEGLTSEMKGRSFSLFARRPRNEEFGENYSVNYMASFAELAQAQRHRTLSYEMNMNYGKYSYYIPPIIRKTELEKEWLKDISSLEKNFPQGMMVMINERGTIENFVLKCTERLCGAAQLEIMEGTFEILEKYKKAVENNSVLSEYLKPYTKGARCTFPGWKCTSPCIFGPKDAVNRII